MRTEPAEILAGEGDAGERLDVVLVSHAAAASRSEAQRLIAAGRVAVDGELRAKRHRVAAGERISVARAQEPAGGLESEAVPYELVHEDEHLLVVDKPAGVVVHPGAGHAAPTLAGALRAQGAAGGSDPGRAGIVHRLDRDTSGLLVVARSEEMHAALAAMIRERQVERGYLALVEGRPDAASGTIDAAVGRDRSRRTLMSTRTDRPRSARTHFQIEEPLPRTTLLQVRLETGRTHQIRAHLAAIGHPVCGDDRYGGGTSGARLGLTRQFLHSARLVFRHPATGESLACESKLPADLRRTLGVARREPVSGGPDGG
ncbi:MAG: RluA family pseudouridine synthase [Thermoleophilaceae bacterium]